MKYIIRSTVYKIFIKHIHSVLLLEESFTPLKFYCVGGCREWTQDGPLHKISTFRGGLDFFGPKKALAALYPVR
jgi:hypothetical protein